jgi:hypothetical protein
MVRSRTQTMEFVFYLFVCGGVSLLSFSRALISASLLIIRNNRIELSSYILGLIVIVSVFLASEMGPHSPGFPDSFRDAV